MRSENDRNKIISFISKSAKNILESPDINKVKVPSLLLISKLIYTGIKCFIRKGIKDSDTFEFRMHSSSLDLFRNYISDKRIVDIDADTALELIDKNNIKVEDFSPKLKQQLEGTATGSLMFRLRFIFYLIGSLQIPFIFPVWRAPVSVCVMLKKPDLQ